MRSLTALTTTVMLAFSPGAFAQSQGDPVSPTLQDLSALLTTTRHVAQDLDTLVIAFQQQAKALAAYDKKCGTVDGCVPAHGVAPTPKPYP